MPGIDSRAARVTWTAALVLLSLGLIYLIRGTLLVFAIAILLACLLYPLMDVIDRGLPSKSKLPAVAITWLLVIGLLAAFGILIGSVVAEQAASLTKAGPAVLERLKHPPSPPSGAVTLKTQITGMIEGQLRDHYDQIVSFIPDLTLKVLAASGNLIYLVLVPVLSFFILRDGRGIRDSFLDLFEEHRPIADETLSDIQTLLLQYMRALSLLCFATFSVFALVFSLMGLPYAILLASVAFPLEFIPMVGPLAAAVIILAVTAVSGFPHLIWVVTFLALFRLVQDYALSPRLMSRGVELHPLMILFGVLAGGEIGGAAGIFLSIPVLAMIRLLYHRMGKVRAARRIRAAS